jgi:hypothetical protein
MNEPYNPLAKLNLADSIEREVLSRELLDLQTLDRFEGAGIYLLYYAGDLDIYAPLKRSLETSAPRPIYVGKAIPEGGRVGGLRTAAVPTRALFNRLKKHAGKIDITTNLASSDFRVRFLVIEDIWIPLGENALIETYAPLWNKVVSGFGNNPVGSGRMNQKPSLWDVLHPPRERIDLSRQPVTEAELKARVLGYFEGQSVPEEDYRDPFEDDEEPG